MDGRHPHRRHHLTGLSRVCETTWEFGPGKPSTTRASAACSWRHSVPFELISLVLMASLLGSVFFSLKGEDKA